MKSKAKANADRAIKELKAARNKGVLVLKSSDKKQFYVHVGARNGEPLQHSETFTRKRNALKNVLAAAKAYDGILAGEKAVYDDRGDAWVYNPSIGKWVLVPGIHKLANMPGKVLIGKKVVTIGKNNKVARKRK